MHMPRRLLAAILALASPTAAAAAAPHPPILLPGSINDGSWNALGFQILQSLKAHGYETSYSENVADADEEQALRDDAARNLIVIGHSGRFMASMEDVAPDFPHTQFIVTSGNKGEPPNIMSIDWNNAQFGCQLGTLAARMSRTHKVAGVYGLRGVPNITAQAGGFRICATRAGAAVTILYVRDMEDAAAAKEAALALIDKGNDVITGKLNAAQSGLIEAARERRVFVTGRSLADSKSAPNAVLTNIIEDWPAMFGTVADQVRAGHISGTFHLYGYDTTPSGASLEYAPGQALNPVVPAPVAAEIASEAHGFAVHSLKVTPTEGDARSGT